MGRLLIGLVVLVGIAAAVAYAFRGEIALSLMQSVVEKNMANNAINELPDLAHGHGLLRRRPAVRRQQAEQLEKRIMSQRFDKEGAPPRL